MKLTNPNPNRWLEKIYICGKNIRRNVRNEEAPQIMALSLNNTNFCFSTKHLNHEPLKLVMYT